MLVEIDNGGAGAVDRRFMTGITAEVGVPTLKVIPDMFGMWRRPGVGLAVVGRVVAVAAVGAGRCPVHCGAGGAAASIGVTVDRTGRAGGEEIAGAVLALTGSVSAAGGDHSIGRHGKGESGDDYLGG